MRLCRYVIDNQLQVGFYEDDKVVPLLGAAEASGCKIPNLTPEIDLLSLLPPDGGHFSQVQRIHTWLQAAGRAWSQKASIPVEAVQLKVPIPRPNKLFLLAGNYAAHIEEGGDQAAERSETFPYVFMKPPTTTLIDPGSPFRLPTVSPECLDYELELAVVMGRGGKGISTDQALQFVAGYVVVNDISDRRFRPNPQRRERNRDTFFDWQHGKWHDGSCPCGPCIISADAIPDPQNLAMRLTVNGEIRQQASTALQVFSVAEVIAFVSSFVTLEPGDIISTGTCAGVGGPKGIFLRAGDRIDATIDGIGTLTTHIEPSGASNSHS